VNGIDWTVAAERFLGTPLQILAILLVAVIGRWLLHRLINSVVGRAGERHADRLRRLPGRAGEILADASGLAHERYVQRTQTVGAVLRSVVTVVVTTLAVLTIMATLGVPLAPLLASAGVGGVALGFGAQSLVRDFLSGIFMIVEDQYGVGDTIDVGDAVGVVEDVSLRVTRLRDRNGVVWYVRNGEIVRVGNQSQGWSTAAITVPFALDADLPQVTEVLRSALADLPTTDERVLESPTVVIESLSAGAITVRVSAKCLPTVHLDVQRDLRIRVKNALDAAGIAGFAAALAAEKSDLAPLRDDLIRGVQDVVPDAVLNGDPLDRLPNNAHFSFPGCPGDALLMLLDAAGVAVSTGSACTAGIPQPSHVLLAMGLPAEDAHASVRFSIGDDTTDEDIAHIAKVTPPIVERLRALAGPAAQKSA